jgi:hypothetical protein
VLGPSRLFVPREQRGTPLRSGSHAHVISASAVEGISGLLNEGSLFVCCQGETLFLSFGNICAHYKGPTLSGIKWRIAGASGTKPVGRSGRRPSQSRPVGHLCGGSVEQCSRIGLHIAQTSSQSCDSKINRVLSCGFAIIALASVDHVWSLWFQIAFYGKLACGWEARILPVANSQTVSGSGSLRDLNQNDCMRFRNHGCMGSAFSDSTESMPQYGHRAVRPSSTHSVTSLASNVLRQ